MHINDIRIERRGDRRRIAGGLRWEDADRPDQLLYFETSDAFADDLEPIPDAFLVAALPLAVWHGERRIRIEGAVSSRLRDGLETVMRIFEMWYERCRPLRIAPTGAYAATLPHTAAGTASFMSGGVDALALLRANRLDYPLDHPASIRDCLVSFGLNTYDFEDGRPDSRRLAAFEAYARRMEQLGELAGFTPIPIYTNVRTLYEDFQTWADVGFGAGIVSAALAMPRRIRQVWLASEGAGLDPPPGGSHPLLDHHFSTSAVEIHHGQAATTRLEKTRLVADWPDALPFLRSCFQIELPREHRINCGACEKCVRTMVALVALGRLEEVGTFPHDDVTAEMLSSVRIRSTHDLIYYSECIAPLERRGRDDLARPLRSRIAGYRRRQRWKQAAGWLRDLAATRAAHR